MLFVFFVLLFSTLGAAIAVADRWFEERSEIVVATGVLWTLFAVGPMYLLGLVDVLTRPSVAIGSLLAAGAAVYAVVRPLDRDALLRLRARVISLLRIVPDGVRIAARWNVLAGIITALAAAYFAWLVVIAYLFPYWSDWDCHWYHEPLVGVTIQNHGFKPEPLPGVDQLINGYQRFGETTQTWFALFGGRRIVDGVNLFLAPVYIVALYGLIRRFIAQRGLAILLASSMILFPGFVRMMRSTMVDDEGGALLLAALFFLTHPNLNHYRKCLFVLAATGAIGTKTALVPCGALACAVFGVRLLFERKKLGNKAFAIVLAASAAPPLAMVLFTYLRNYLHYKDPFWPVTFESKSLGWRFIGAQPIHTYASLSAHMPYLDLWHRFVAKPYSVLEHGTSWQVDDYTFGISWLVLPMMAAGIFIAPVTYLYLRIREWRRDRSAPPSAATERAKWAAVLGALAFVGFAMSPIINAPRFTLAPIAAGIALECWMFSTRRLRQAATALAFMLPLSFLMMTYWEPPDRQWLKTPGEVWELAKMTPTEREVSAKGGAGIDEKVGLQREKDLGEGDVVAWDADNILPSFLWNNAFSNRAVYVGNAPDRMAEVERLHAKWVVPGAGSPLAKAVAAPNSGWELVGPLSFAQAYRRIDVGQ